MAGDRLWSILYLEKYITLVFIGSKWITSPLPHNSIAAITSFTCLIVSSKVSSTNSIAISSAYPYLWKAPERKYITAVIRI